MAQAGIVPATPIEPIAVDHPEGVPPTEAQVVLVLVVDAEGNVESAIVTSTLPADLPPEYGEVAAARVRKTRFRPTTRDGRPIRSRIEHVVVFDEPEGVPADEPELEEAAERTAEPAEPIEVEVRGAWRSPRGVGDVTVRRELLEASPRQQSSELLSAAPGFFVDHEDGEGLGNNVFLRGFDLEHGSGIEIGVGNVAINQPVHIQGQGYADANFVIPEVVDSIDVLSGPYDPRQGDAAIVGSAFFNLAVPERGYHLATSYGSFDQARVLGIIAPESMTDETFAAFAVRKTDGFGARRTSRSGSANAQIAADLSPNDTVRALGTAYAARTDLPGVVREDHVDSGQIGFYESYPFFAENQGARASRVLASAEWRHTATEGGRFDLSIWTMWTDFSTRQNFAGAFESSQIDPEFAGLGDLFERTNEETALGLQGSYESSPLELGRHAISVIEPGVVVRIGSSEQSKRLLVPDTLDAWDRRTDAGVRTLDLGGYIDADLRFFDRLRLAGGPRVDVLAVSVDDRLENLVPAGIAPPGALAGGRRSAVGVAAGPRVTAEYAVSDLLAVSTSYGEGFRSLDAASLEDGASKPFSKVRSIEAGARGRDARGRYETTLAVFNTWVENELVFVAEVGGFETQSRSIRRGVVGSLVAEPARWFLASTALSITDAFFQTNVPNVSRRVPSVPPVLYRVDVAVRGTLARIDDRRLTARAGLGYTLLSPLHLTDEIRGPTSHILNATAGLRYSFFELDLDAFNVLDLEYPEDANYYLSNWSFVPGQQRASFATHLQAAPPLTVVATLGVHL